MFKSYYRSEVGIIEVTGNEEGISSVSFIDGDKNTEYETFQVHPLLRDCMDQIDGYFRGSLKEFDVKLQIKGTEFQSRVWKELLKIPYGETASYRDIAAGVGDKKAVRAVGSANGNNRIAIIIPCHRVIGSNGKLTGYAGGLWRKEWLLKHEAVYK